MKLVTGGATAARVMLAGMAMVACMQAAPVCAQRMDPDVRVLRAILEKPEAEIDLARARLAIDQLIDPAVDIEDTLAKLDAMAATVKALAGPRAKSAEIAQVLRSYLYDAGTWNHRLPFRYDLEGDPLGREIPGKLLTNYLATRKGNCVSMPTLASAKPRSNYPLLQMVNAATQCARVVAASIVLMMATATTHEALAESLEQCIDRFCVGPRAKSYDVWASSLGSRTGAAVPGEDARRTLCIRDRRSKAYLILGFSGDGPVGRSKLDSLFLTTQGVCDRGGIGTFSIAHTERGLKLGSSRHDIERLLGKPGRIDDAVSCSERSTISAMLNDDARSLPDER